MSPDQKLTTEEHIERRRSWRQERRRTILWATVCAGLVSLVIVRIAEVQALNKQVDRSRRNCVAVQSDRRAFRDQYQEQHDQVLGNPRKHIKPFVFEGTPFEKFKPLILAQAIGNQKRAAEFASRIEDCNAIFPKYSAVPFFG